jgi:hypothetical protein
VIDLVFDRSIRLYRMVELGTASSQKQEQEGLGKRNGAIRGEILINEQKSEDSNIQSDGVALNDDWIK